MNNTQSLPKGIRRHGISRVDYSKHPHAKLISIGVGIVGLLVLYAWALTAV